MTLSDTFAQSDEIEDIRLQSEQDAYADANLKSEGAVEGEGRRQSLSMDFMNLTSDSPGSGGLFRTLTSLLTFCRSLLTFHPCYLPQV